MISTGRVLVFIGLLCLLHAAYSATQHRSYIRLTEQDFDSLPVDIIAQAIIALIITILGVIEVAGIFKEIDATAELREKTWDSFGNRPSFYIFNHRPSIILDNSSEQ